MRPAAAFVGRAGGAGGADHRPAAPGRPSPPILLAVVTAAVAMALVASMGWRLTGGSLYAIVTPSMCPDLCVGALVLDRPLQGPVRVGEVVTFHPPGTSTLYTHRVAAVLADGSFKTAGDALKTVDPWTVPVANVVGRVVAGAPALGWLWRCLPWMAAALACAILARRSIRVRSRKPYDLLVTTLLVVVPVLVLRPLVRGTVMAWHRRRGGAVVMHVVNSGLLPAQFRATGAAVVGHVGPGQILTLVASPRGRQVWIHQAASFWWWQWVLVAGVVLLPVLGLLAGLTLHRLRPTRLAPAPAPAPPALRWTQGQMANAAWPGPGTPVRGQPPWDPLR